MQSVQIRYENNVLHAVWAFVYLLLIKENYLNSSSFIALGVNTCSEFWNYYCLLSNKCLSVLWAFLVGITARDTSCELEESNLMLVALFPFHQIYQEVEKPFVYSLRV